MPSKRRSKKIEPDTDTDVEESSSSQNIGPQVSEDLNPLTYPYTPTEKLVLTLEPYKSQLLPHWRFKTREIAHESSSVLWAKFLEYESKDDFIGMDMARKYIQMGMTRAKRYANYSGGRKYATGNTKGEKGQQIAKSEAHKGKEEKEEASAIFREVWERCKSHDGYQTRKEEWIAETKRLKAEAKENCQRSSRATNTPSRTGRQQGGVAARRQRKTAQRRKT